MKKTLGQTMDRLCEAVAWIALLIVGAVMLAVGSAFAADPQPASRPVSQAIVLGFGASSQSLTNGFQSSINTVRLVCDISCHIAFGTSAAGLTAQFVATRATGMLLTPLVPEYFRVSPGQGVAVIRANGNSLGNLFIIEMTQ